MVSLFKIDSKGKIRILQIFTEGTELRRLAGIYGGNLVDTGKACVGKNVGRANETTGEEQAVLEAASEVAKKIREGYVRSDYYKTYTEVQLKAYIINNSLPIPDCMLAVTAKKVDYEKGQLMSKKLDGMRCMAVISEEGVTLYSRGRKEITTMEHIEDELMVLHKETGFVGILDGELYYHDTTSDNFQDIMKACKKYRKGVSEKVEYHVYDIIDEEITATDRWVVYNETIMTYRMKILEAALSAIIIVPQHLVTSEEEADRWHSRFLEAGYEGSMLKGPNSMYRQGSRSKDLQKRKDFMAEEYEVVDMIPMNAYPLQAKAVLFCHRTKQQFKATPKMSHTKREELLTNKENYIGATATIKFFGYTDSGVPRIAVLKEFHFPGDLEDFRIKQSQDV